MRTRSRLLALSLWLSLGAFAACTSTAPSAPLPPVANAGIDQVVRFGAEVHLDGSLSHRASGATTGLTYDWYPITIPAGSSAALSDPTAAQPTFVVDTRGEYIFRLVVRDGSLESRPDVVVVHGAINLGVVSITPDERAWVVAEYEPVTVVFTEPVQQESVDANSFYVTDGVTTINGTIQLSEGNLVATFVPLQPYPLGQTMKVVLTTRIVDLTGGNLGGMFQSYFTVTTGADTRDPTVASITPTDGATDVDRTAAISVGFSEAMDTVSMSIDSDSDGCPDNIVLELQGGACVPGTIEISGGGTRALFVPAVVLDPSATYTLTVVGGLTGLHDVEGNALALDSVSTFTTAAGTDNTPPRLLWSDPQAGLEGIQVRVRPLAQLSEPIDAATFTEVSVTLDGPDGLVSGQALLSNANRTITFVPDMLLAVDTIYTLHISGALTDLAGNALDGDGDGIAGGDLLVTFHTTTDATFLALEIQPATIVLHVGSTLRLTARVTSTDGSVTDVTSQAAWLVEDAPMASINSVGLLRALGAGVTAVTASFADLNDTVLVTIVPALALTPPDATVPPRGQVAFSASGGQPPYTFAVTVNDSGASITAGGAYRAGSIGNVTDRVTVYDSAGGSAGGSVDAAITVTRAIAILPSVASVPPRGSITFSATGGDTNYSFALLQNNSGATFNTSTHVYRAGPTGTQTDTLQVTDGVGATAVATINVGPELALSPLTPSTAPLGNITFTATGGDGSYTFSFASPPPSGGSIGATTGTYVAGSTGSVADTVRVTDGVGAQVQTTVTVTAALSLGIQGGGAATIYPRGTLTLAGASGAGGYTYAFVTNNSGGSVNPSTGVYTAGSTGSVTDTVRVTDSNGATATRAITVTAAIGLGVVSPPSATTPVPPLSTRTFTASGGSGSYTYSITANNSGGSITGGGAYTAGLVGAVSDTVRVTDSAGATASLTVPVGPEVALTPSAVGVLPTGTQSFSASGGDGSYTYSLPTNNSGGSINPTTGFYTAGSTGLVIDTVQVEDGLGATATATVNVGSTPPLAISPTAASRAPGGSIAFTATGGLGGYTYSFQTNNSGGSINPSTGAYVAGNTGSVTDTVRVSDGTNTATATVTVTAAIAISPLAPSTPPGGSVAFGATGGNGSYTFSISTNNSGGSINATSGAYVAGNTGSVIDTVTVTDGLGKTASTTVSVGPVVAISPTTASVAPLGSVSFSATGGDGSYSFAFRTAPPGNNSGGSITSGGAYTAGAVGSVTDTVRVTDGLGKTSDATITVGPIVAISPTTTTVPPTGAVSFSASGGNGAYTYSIPTNNSGASINASTGAYVAGTTPSVVDTVRVTDGLGSAAQATVNVSAAVQPTVSLVAPSSISRGSTLNLTVSGSSFQNSATVSLSGTGITVNNVSFNSSTQLTVNVTVACSATIGSRDLTVTNPGGLTSTLSGAVSVTAYVLVAGDLRINEVVTSPQQDWSDSVPAGEPFDAAPGSDTPDSRDEWVEIYSAAACAADISTVRLDTADGTGTLTLILGTDVRLDFSGTSTVGAFMPGNYVVVSRAVNPQGLSMADDVWIRLYNAGDTLTYDDVELGTLNYEGDGSANNAPSGASTSPSDEAVYRHPNGSDTNNDAVNFTKGAATIGSANP